MQPGTRDLKGHIWEMLVVLSRDVSLAEQALVGGSQFARRMYIRAVFAQVEGAVFLVKRDCINNPRASEIFSPAELCLLREESYSLDSRGEAATQPKFLPLEQNLRFALDMLARDPLGGVDLQYGGRDWQQFKQALKLRHRLTHPKAAALLDVSDAELDVVQAAHKWFQNLLAILLAASLRLVREEVAELKAKASKLQAAE